MTLSGGPPYFSGEAGRGMGFPGGAFYYLFSFLGIRVYMYIYFFLFFIFIVNKFPLLKKKKKAQLSRFPPLPSAWGGKSKTSWGRFPSPLSALIRAL